MERIRGSSFHYNTYQIPAQPRGAVEASAEKKNMQVTGASGNRDTLEVSNDWRTQAADFLEQIEQEYKDISILVGQSADRNSIPRLAAGLGKGTYLVVSEEFLERMGNSKEEFMKCKTAMTQILEKLSGDAGKYLSHGAVLGEKNITPWSVPIPEKEEVKFPVPESGKETGYGFSTIDEWKHKFTYKCNNYSAAAIYSRLAGAATKGQVSSVLGEAHRNMGSLRLAAALGNDKDKAKAQAAIGSLQKLLVRGKQKMRRLDEETLTKIKKNRAQKKNELKRARQMKLELERKRSRRNSADSALRAEGMLDDVNRKLQFQEEKEWGFEAAMPVMPDAALLPGGMDPVSAGTVFTASEVAIGAEITF